MGRVNKSHTQIQGTGAFYNNKYQIIVSTFDKGKPDGATLTYLDSIQTQLRYSYFKEGVEEILYEGSPLKFVHNMELPNDE